MKELDTLFNEINIVIENTHFLNSGKSHLPIKFRITKKKCKSESSCKQ